MSCCHLTRRQLMRWSAIAASTALVPILDPERSYAATRAAAVGSVVAIDLELVTLTETSAVITWYTAQPGAPGASLQMAPMPTTVNAISYGTSPLAMTQTVLGQADTAYHYLELTGLEPGQTYFYVATSDGTPALPSTFATGNPAGPGVAAAGEATVYSFTTPQPPKGDFLFAVALCNDLHLGETVAGLAYSNSSIPGGGIPPGFSTPPGEPPYSQTMAKALVADATARGARYLFAAGDVSSEAALVDVRQAKAILDGFGGYDSSYFVARGNHDRPHTDSSCAPSTCTPGKFDDGTYDHFREVFYPGAAAGPTWASHDLSGLHVVTLDTYDKTGNGSDNGILSEEQFSWFASDLAAHHEQPTLVFGHHPITVESTVVNANPVRFDLDPAQAMRVEALYAATPGVFFHQAGHTHRNYRSVGTTATHVTFQETGAVKEYPGGFSLLRLFTGGYAVNFYKTRADLAREWSERTRQEDFTVGPFYVFGGVGDRNYVVDRDLSGLSSAAAPGAAPVVPASPSVPSASAVAHPTGKPAVRERITVRAAHPGVATPTRSLAYTGLDTATAILAGAAVAAAAGVAVTARRAEPSD